MGCEYCGRDCNGPLYTMDDLEAACGCDCHCCPVCGSAYCEKMGGDEPCASLEEELEY